MNDQSHRLTTPTKLSYAVGAIAYGVKDQGFQGLLLIYYNQVLGLPAAQVSAALMLALLMDALIDPAIGHASDSWRSRWGRRHPFMYVSIIPTCVTFYLVWNPPAELTHGLLFAYLLISALALRASISLFEIPNAALMPELTRRYDERTSLLSWRYLFGIVGAFGMVIAVFSWLLAPTPEYPTGQLNPAGYRAYSLVAIALILSTMLISSLGTQRVARSLAAPAKRSRSARTWIKDAFDGLGNRSLLIMLGFGVFSGLANGLSTALNLYFGTFYWGLDGPSLSVLAIAALVGTLVAAVLATPLSRRIGKKQAALSTLFVAGLLPIMPLMLRQLEFFPGNGSPLLLPLLFAERAISLAAVMIAIIVGASMAADIVEEVEIKTGRRAEGLLQAANTLVAKAVSGLGILSAGLLLAAVNFPQAARSGEVPPPILSSLAYGYTAVVLVAYAISIACLARYPITRKSHEDRLRSLASE